MVSLSMIFLKESRELDLKLDENERCWMLGEGRGEKKG